MNQLTSLVLYIVLFAQNTALGFQEIGAILPVIEPFNQQRLENVYGETLSPATRK